MAQPPVSMAIRQLEQELGVPLLERTTRGVVPTEAGADLMVRALAILDQVEDTRLAIGRHKVATGVRTLRIGVIAGPLAAAELTGPIFQAIRDGMPGLELVIEETTFGDQTARLLNGDFDLAIVRPPVCDDDLMVVPLSEEPRCMVVGVCHPLADAGELSVDDVLDQPMLGLVAPEPWASFWQLDEHRGRQLIYEGSPPVGTVNAVQMALITTQGAITVSQSTTRLAGSPLIRSIRLPDASPSVTAMARRRDDARPEVRRVLELAAEAAATNIDLLPDGRIPA
jgi:DNA-binding transcriptional LysR family regulator